MRVFIEKLKLSCISEGPQANIRTQRILNLSAQPEKVTPSVNGNTDREITLKSMQFRRAFSRILQAIWEVDPLEGPVWVSKIDVIDVYHRGNLRTSQVGEFAYVVPSAPDDDGIIICVDLVLPMGWVESPKFFCDFSETLTDVTNALVDTYLPVPSYGGISELQSTGPVPPHTRRSLTNIDCYTDDVISLVQGGTDQQHRVFDSKGSAFKWLFP